MHHSPILDQHFQLVRPLLWASLSIVDRKICIICSKKYLIFGGKELFQSIVLTGLFDVVNFYICTI